MISTRPKDLSAEAMQWMQRALLEAKGRDPMDLRNDAEMLSSRAWSRLATYATSGRLDVPRDVLADIEASTSSRWYRGCLRSSLRVHPVEAVLAASQLTVILDEWAVDALIEATSTITSQQICAESLR